MNIGSRMYAESILSYALGLGRSGVDLSLKCVLQLLFLLDSVLVSCINGIDARNADLSVDPREGVM